MAANNEAVKGRVAAIHELPRRGLLGNSVGIRRAGAVRDPGSKSAAEYCY
jgi:hypothetical protein